MYMATFVSQCSRAQRSLIRLISSILPLFLRVTSASAPRSSPHYQQCFRLLILLGTIAMRALSIAIAVVTPLALSTQVDARHPIEKDSMKRSRPSGKYNSRQRLRAQRRAEEYEPYFSYATEGEERLGEDAYEPWGKSAETSMSLMEMADGAHGATTSHSKAGKAEPDLAKAPSAKSSKSVKSVKSAKAPTYDPKAEKVSSSSKATKVSKTTTV